METARARHSNLHLLLLLCAAMACGKKATTEDAAPIKVDTYTVRGKVVAPRDAVGTVQIHHEAIPTFKTVSGTVSGMMAMEMPFFVEANIGGDLKAGDLLEFRVETHWDKKPPLRIVSLTKLPPETALKLGMH